VDETHHEREEEVLVAQHDLVEGLEVAVTRPLEEVALGGRG
jgi:hypothetical protein